MYRQRIRLLEVSRLTMGALKLKIPNLEFCYTQCNMVFGMEMTRIYHSHL